MKSQKQLQAGKTSAENRRHQWHLLCQTQHVRGSWVAKWLATAYMTFLEEHLLICCYYGQAWFCGLNSNVTIFIIFYIERLHIGFCRIRHINMHSNDGYVLYVNKIDHFVRQTAFHYLWLTQQSVRSLKFKSLIQNRPGSRTGTLLDKQSQQEVGKRYRW